MKKLFTLKLFTLLVAAQLFGQGNGVPGFFQLTVTDLPGSATNRAVVKARAISSIIPEVSLCDVNDVFYTDIFAGFKFAIKYPVASNITNVNVGSNNGAGACPDPGDNGGTEGHHNILRANATPHVEGGFRVTIFQQGADPIPCPTNWVLNQWITICTINITLVAPGCSVCEDLDIVELGEFPVAEQSLDLDHTLAYLDDGSPDPPPPAIEYDLDPFNGPLPLNLLSFDAQKSGTTDALLKWNTANEENTSHFQIQRSYNKELWFNVGEVKAAGFSTEIKNYNFTDYQVYNGRDARLQVYYRLNMVDVDGRHKYSNIETVVFGNSLTTGREFLVYPNPASDGVQVEWDANGVEPPTAIEFYDITGKLIHRTIVSDQTNQQYIDFRPTGIYSGLYLMRIMSGDEAIEHKQIVVGRTQ